jgi:2-polyprenyl-3-methyl-5-hydroxy-6-metoxy-1,4-benzoquinol methylase
MSLDFYRAFEDRHRGSRDTIQERQRAYLPFLRDLAAAYPQAGVTDVGCGRGEWLELLRNEGVRAQGVDLDEGMLAACRELGLDVRRGDAVAYLQSLPADSQMAVSGFHIAEHLPFGTLRLMVAEALRVLVPGGVLILETPNPENLVVGTAGFYMDPTHERPLPHLLLSFVAEYQGFARVKTMRMQESPLLAARENLALMDVLGGASPDYAIVAQKAAPTLAGLLDAAFEPEHGLSLDTLATRYDNKLKSDIHVASVNALQAERHAREAADFAAWVEPQLKQMQLRLAQSENSAHAAYAMAQALRHELAERTWRRRLSAPLRAVARRVLTPAVRTQLVSVTKRLGVYKPLHALYRRIRPLPPAPPVPATPGAAPPGTLSPAAQRAMDQLDTPTATPEDAR